MQQTKQCNGGRTATWKIPGLLHATDLAGATRAATGSLARHACSHPPGMFERAPRHRCPRRSHGRRAGCVEDDQSGGVAPQRLPLFPLSPPSQCCAVQRLLLVLGLPRAVPCPPPPSARGAQPRPQQARWPDKPAEAQEHRGSCPPRGQGVGAWLSAAAGRSDEEASGSVYRARHHASVLVH